MGQNASKCRRYLLDAIASVREAIDVAGDTGDTDAERQQLIQATVSILHRLTRIEYHLGDRIQCGKANG